VVTGSTGFQWPRDFEQTLKDKKISWIFATNFSLGVLIVKQLIERLHQVDHILPNRKCSIHEIHHTKKLDAPSGTALSMKEWLQEDCEITSEREGDVVGHHALKVDTGSEVITLTHEALDRRLFAEGAIFAAKLLTTKTLEPGLHPFQRVVERHLSI
jgi:4-hydroxy-tetrahydrodipicolinate reductase